MSFSLVGVAIAGEYIDRTIRINPIYKGFVNFLPPKLFLRIASNFNDYLKYFGSLKLLKDDRSQLVTIGTRLIAPRLGIASVKK